MLPLGMVDSKLSSGNTRGAQVFALNNKNGKRYRLTEPVSKMSLVTFIDGTVSHAQSHSAPFWQALLRNTLFMFLCN